MVGFCSRDKNNYHSTEIHGVVVKFRNGHCIAGMSQGQIVTKRRDQNREVSLFDGVIIGFHSGIAIKTVKKAKIQTKL